jgi:hypothetical protein
MIADWASRAEVNRHDVAGAIGPLVHLLSGLPAQRDEAARALRFLSFNNPLVYGGAVEYRPQFVSFDHVATIVAAGAAAPLVACVRDGTGAQRESAAAALCNVANISAHRTAVAKAGAIEPLVELARDTDPANATAARHAVAALGSLAFQHAANREAVKAAAEPTLVRMARGDDDVPQTLRRAAEYALSNLTPAPPRPAAAPPPAAPPAKAAKAR